MKPSSDLIKMGLVVISYTIKDISDPSGYLKSYGAKAIAAVKRDERIKTAEAECRSRIKGTGCPTRSMFKIFGPA